MNVRIGPLPAACYWHGGGVPLEQTTADPGGTTIVVLFLGGGGSLLLKLQPPNASGSTKAIRQVMRMRCIPADGTAFANEVAGQARWTPTAPNSATCYWHVAPAGQTTVEPGGTTIVVLLFGGGGLLLLKLQPPNPIGSNKRIRRVTRI